MRHDRLAIISGANPISRWRGRVRTRIRATPHAGAFAHAGKSQNGSDGGALANASCDKALTWGDGASRMRPPSD
jgi:hypothetical protein